MKHPNFLSLQSSQRNALTKFCCRPSSFSAQAGGSKTAPQLPTINQVTKMMMNVAHEADSIPTTLPTMIKDKEEQPTRLKLTITSEKTKNKSVKDTETEPNESSCESVGQAEETQRYLPKNKKPDAALTFPEKVRLTTWKMLSMDGRDIT
jgi:hypothetical protein